MSKREKPVLRYPSFYAITTFLIEGDRVVRSDSPGFFWTEDEAVSCVLKNYGDWIETGYYRYAVVEQYERSWTVRVSEEAAVVPCKPAERRQICPRLGSQEMQDAEGV